ncbi:GNAT family N-acetyltransferase [Agarivorans gilvus]|uniref:N-acetyltransferase n=1 Tax=Agarivorans gilvus TaxID=680279 RepID=A0ABQ1I6M0_9ALTE|nr:GNAT family N-acetyltransferase [Agarivorans gilvus]GGB21891.1 N-acetyltransferase [Agarivorans gilvus]
MLVLREMRLEEFPAYRDYFIDDYSKEISENYGHSMDVAIQLAETELNCCFPNGVETAAHSLLCIEITVNHKPQLLGYLWHSPNQNDSATFIYDFYISSEYRGLGYGTQVISELEKQLLAQGIKQIKLRVAYHNERALKLYKELGFAITGFNLSKQLASE